MKTKTIDYETLPEIIDFQGHFMRLFKRSRNVAMLEKISTSNPYDFIVARIYRTYADLPIGIRDAKETLVLKECWGNILAWTYNDFKGAKAEYNRLVRVYR